METTLMQKIERTNDEARDWNEEAIASRTPGTGVPELDGDPGTPEELHRGTLEGK
jgi:hypothetical protein